MQTPSLYKMKSSVFTSNNNSRDKNIFLTPSIFGNYFTSFKNSWNGSSSRK